MKSIFTKSPKCIFDIFQNTFKDLSINIMIQQILVLEKKKLSDYLITD